MAARKRKKASPAAQEEAPSAAKPLDAGSLPKIRIIVPPQPKVDSVDHSLESNSGNSSDSTSLSDLPEIIIPKPLVLPGLDGASSRQKESQVLRRWSGKPAKITIDSDEEDELCASPPASPPSKRLKSKADGQKGKGKEAEKPSWATKVVLLIPVVSVSKADDFSNQRKSISVSVSFKEALQIIHDTIGCSGVRRMPELRYKLSSKPQKDKPVSLQTDEDWDGLRETLEEEQKRKKSVIEVSIIVSEQYLASLRSLKADGKPGATTVRNRRQGKGSERLIDLNLSDGDEDQDDHGNGLMEREQAWYTKLEKKLTQCQKCGPTKFCKINRSGEHVNLTFNQRRGWAVALAQETHNVTLDAPPSSVLFAEFHGSGSSRKVGPTTPQTPTPVPAHHGFAPQHMGTFSPFMLNPWLPVAGPAGMAFLFNSGHASLNSGHASLNPHRQSSSSHIPSSDPPDEGQANPYPSIDDFITKLHKDHSKRNLSRYISIFETLDFYNIDELAKLSEDRLTGPDFNFTPGNAQFLLSEVKREMKRIDRGRHTK